MYSSDCDIIINPYSNKKLTELHYYTPVRAKSTAANPIPQEDKKSSLPDRLPLLPSTLNRGLFGSVSFHALPAGFSAGLYFLISRAKNIRVVRRSLSISACSIASLFCSTSAFSKASRSIRSFLVFSKASRARLRRRLCSNEGGPTTEDRRGCAVSFSLSWRWSTNVVLSRLSPLRGEYDRKSFWIVSPRQRNLQLIVCGSVRRPPPTR